MRLEITMNYEDNRFEIPINYNYLFYKALNTILRSGNYYWQDIMYEDICCHRLDEESKLYTFSKFLNPKVFVSGSLLSGYGESKLYFSAPVQNKQLIGKLVQSLNHNNIIYIEYDNKMIEFEIQNVNCLDEPIFRNVERFVMLSPTTVSKVRYVNNEKLIQYLKATDEETPRVLAYNLRKKYELIFKKKYNGTLDIKLDANYINFKGGAEGVSKLITIFENSSKETRIKSFITPLTIIGRSEIISVAYQCGIGEHNSLGMGMIEKLEKTVSFVNLYNSKKRNSSDDLIDADNIVEKISYT